LLCLEVNMKDPRSPASTSWKLRTALLVGALAFFAPTVVVGQAVVEPAVTSLRLGALFPQSGDLAFGAADALQGVQIAVELFNEINEHGIEVELVTADAPNPAGGAAGVRQLVTTNRAQVVIGTYASAIASAAAPAAERLNVPYVETTAFAEGITRNTGNVIRTTISSGALGAAAMDFVLTGLAERLGVAEADMRVALVHTDDEFGVSIADAALARLNESPATLVLTESYPAATTRDLSSVLLRIRQTEPHAVVHIAQVPDATLLWRQAQQLDVYLPAVVGAGGGYGQAQFAAALGDNVNGIFNVVPPTSGSINTESLSPQAQELLGELRDRVAARGWTQGNYTDWAFMGTWVFLDEILPRAASLSVADLMAAAAEVQVDALDSVTGFGFEFIPAGEPNSGQNLRAIPVVQQWQEGTLRVVYPEALAVGEFIHVPLPTWGERTERIAD
jgi:branched-chain amino acid transport system substrate-binding protein